jgi:hypothetical protein
METKTWKEQAQSAFSKYLSELEQDLPSGSTVNDIEKKLVESSPRFLLEVMKSRVEAENFPPNRD